MKLLDQVRQVARLKHRSYRTENCYVYWITRYIRHHDVRYPNTMGTREVEQFLAHLAVQDNVSASTQNQALGALLFLYRDVLQIDIGPLDAVRARRPVRVPTVLSQKEVQEFLAAVDQLPTTEPYGWMARLLYGSGLRLMECCRLRLKDIDLERGQIRVRQAKGNKDRWVMLPIALQARLLEQMEGRSKLHALDLSKGLGRVALPGRPRRACARRWMRSRPRSRGGQLF